MLKINKKILKNIGCGSICIAGLGIIGGTVFFMPALPLAYILMSAAVGTGLFLAGTSHFVKGAEDPSASPSIRKHESLTKIMEKQARRERVWGKNKILFDRVVAEKLVHPDGYLPKEITEDDWKRIQGLERARKYHENLKHWTTEGRRTSIYQRPTQSESKAASDAGHVQSDAGEKGKGTSALPVGRKKENETTRLISQKEAE